MKWGLIPFWAKDPKIGFEMINAREEDIDKKPAFRKPTKSQRCLIPATGFYEWKKVRLENKEEKFPWYFKLKDQEIFSFAGIYDIWKDPEGYETYSYSVITTKPNDTVKSVHNRMPVILQKRNEGVYLNPDTPLSEILALLVPFPDKNMISWPVKQLVNSATNDGPELIKELDEKRSNNPQR